MPDADDMATGLAAWPDFRRLCGLTGGTLASAFIPQSADGAFAAKLQKVIQRLSPSTLESIERKMRCALPAEAGMDHSEAARRFVRMFVEDAWGRSRGVRRFGWRPDVRIEGLEKLDQALARGRGALLWGLRFASSTAIKQAFFRADRPLVHLSRAEHGSATRTRLGVELIAPLYCRAENPYLKERIIIPLDRSLGYLKTLRERLGQNATVSIYAEHTGRQNVSASVLTTELEFAVGAPSLAWTHDAALLTVSAHREGPFQYRIVIADEIPVDRSISRKDFAAQAVRELARRLEQLIVRYPSDWQGWMYRDFPEC